MTSAGNSSQPTLKPRMNRGLIFVPFLTDEGGNFSPLMVSFESCSVILPYFPRPTIHIVMTTKNVLGFVLNRYASVAEQPAQAEWVRKARRSFYDRCRCFTFLRHLVLSWGLVVFLVVLGGVIALSICRSVGAVCPLVFAERRAGPLRPRRNKVTPFPPSPYFSQNL